MAREQVKDLPGRGVRPANIRGGTVGVVVQQAEEPAIMGLARSLNGVNKALQNYHSMGATVSEMEEKRIMSMTPEERAEELNKTKAKLDGAERKGLIPFLGNPLNWERNKKALAVGLAGDLYDEMTSDTGRLKNPKQHDDTRSLDEIVQEEVGNFLGENPAIEGQQIVLDEFYRAFEGKRRAIQREYGDRQSKVIKNNITKQRANQIYETYANLVLTSPGDREEAQAFLQETFDELQFLTIEQKLQVIGNITNSLAESDPESWDDFLRDAQKLKVGNALFETYKKEIADMEANAVDIIDRNQDRESRELARKRQMQKSEESDLANSEKHRFRSNMSMLGRGLPVELNGQTYTSQQDFQEAFLEVMDDAYATQKTNVHGEVVAYIEDEYNPINRNDSVFYAMDQRSDAAEINQSVAGNVSTEAALLDAELEASINITKGSFRASQPVRDILGLNARNLREVRASLLQKASEQDLSFTDQVEWFNEKYEAAALKIEKNSIKQIQDLKKSEQRKSEDSEKAKQQLQQSKSSGKVATKPWVLRESPMQLRDRIEHNLNLAVASPDKAIQQQALEEARNFININDLRALANGDTPKVEAWGSDVLGEQYTHAAIPYSTEEKESFRLLAERVEALSGFYTDIDALEQQRTITGVAFDPTKLNPYMHFILTPEEVEREKPNDMIERKAKIIKDISAEDLLKAQKEVYEQRKHLLPLIDG